MFISENRYDINLANSSWAPVTHLSICSGEGCFVRYTLRCPQALRCGGEPERSFLLAPKHLNLSHSLLLCAGVGTHGATV